MQASKLSLVNDHAVLKEIEVQCKDGRSTYIHVYFLLLPHIVVHMYAEIPFFFSPLLRIRKLSIL